jgi:maltose-binding protein MalE
MNIINRDKVQRLLELQLRANREIDVYGMMGPSTWADMMELADSLNEAEQDEYLMLSLSVMNPVEA